MDASSAAEAQETRVQITKYGFTGNDAALKGIVARNQPYSVFVKDSEAGRK
jgi:hypothetical protein